MFERISNIIAIGSCALVFVFIFATGVLGQTAVSTKQDNPELARMKALLDCTCECRLTLAYCEIEDADCSVRPALLTKLKGLLDQGKREMELILAFMGPLHPVKEQLMEARLQNRQDRKSVV